MKKPNLFIVGASKCGTTALHDFLNQHPEILMSTPKEPQYFCKDFHAEYDKYNKHKRIKRHNYYPIRTEQDYLACFSNWNGEKIVGEASPSYLTSTVAAKEIKKFNPNAKIIILIRNPVDYVYSLHNQCVSSGHETEPDFEKALALEPERKHGKHLPKRSLLSSPHKLYYRERASFTKQIQRYLDEFDRDQIKIIIYDDFKNDNLGVYKDILSFLGVDTSFVPKITKKNISRTVKNIPLKTLFESSFFIKYIWALPKMILPKKTYQQLRRSFYHTFLAKPHEREPLKPELRKKLMTEFKPEVAKLSAITGQNLLKKWRYQ